MIGTISVLVAGGLVAACASDKSTATAGQPVPVSASPRAVAATHASPTASPSRSAAPKPTPKPVAAGWPDASTTGVQPGIKLTKRSGEILVRKSGTVIQNLDLDGDIRVEANNVTVRNVRITNAGRHSTTYWGIVQWMGHSGLDVEHVTIIGSGTTQLQVGVASLGGVVTVRWCDIGGISKKGVNTQQGVVEDNYLHDPHYYASETGEVDMVRVDGGPVSGTTLTVRHNTIFNQLNATSAIAIYSNPGNPCHDITVADNLLGGGGYTIYAGGDRDPTYNIVISGNVFSTKVKAEYGPAAFFNRHGPGNLWQGNKWDSGRTASAP
jgi:hypothetical protein